MQERRDTILIVDDIEMDRTVLRELLEGDYNLLEAENGVQAMLLLEEYRSNIAVVLLKIELAMENGRLVMEEIHDRGILDEVPVVTIVTERSRENEARAFELGASDIVIKPFEPHVVSGRLQNIAGLYYYRRHMQELVEKKAQDLRESNEVLTDALSSVIEYRSMESGQHVLRIRMFTKILLRSVARSCPEYNLDERKINVISQAAAMHDIGKIAIPDSILNKPGRLTDEEFDIMKTHAIKGSELLETIAGLGNEEYLGYAYRICRYHHERWDGKGYPDGLTGEAIPICAQVAGVADCYDALTTDRVYKKAYAHEKAVNMILNGECGAFSPKLLECFKNVRSQFRELAREYADGRAPGGKFPPEAALSDRTMALDTPQLAQTKYFILLRYLGCTVIEADVDNDIFHMVYAPDNDFEVLRTGGTFSEALNEFYRACVHPDDRGVAEEHMQDYLVCFFREGLLKKSREYRIFLKSVGAYHWFRCTTLRVDTENPHRHRVILIWQDIGAERTHTLDVRRNGETTDESMCRNIPGAIFLCRNDAEFTILRKGSGFAGMFGYTETEFWERFHGSFLQMVCLEDRKMLQDALARQLFHGNLVECEYRVRCHDGSDKWVLGQSKLLEEEGEERLYCVLVDVTRSKRDQEELRLSLERHQIIMNQTNDIIFEWDILHDKVIYSSNWEKKFGYSPLSDNYQAMLKMFSHIHPDDTGHLMELMGEIRGGTPYVESEYRVAKADGHYIWCRIRATAQLGAGGKPIKAVGVILDIDAEKRAAARLQARAEQDALTGLYNKAAAKTRVERYLGNSAPRDLSAMLVLDVDNFKLVNDRYGHMFGDAVLTQLAKQIKGLSRGGDVVSRIGGDEFLVFLPLLPDHETAKEKAEDFIRAIRSAVEDAPETCELSCSMGIAFAPEHGVTFRDLFQRADLALYQAKKEGKNRLRVYEQGEMDEPFGGGLGVGRYSALGARIDSDDENAIDEMGLVQYALERLYQSGDVDEAVEAILKLVGERFNVSRVYIFEDTDDGLYCRNTYEWCNKGVVPQKSQLLMVNYDEDLGGDYRDNFDDNGIFYCPDITQLPSKQYGILGPQGIKSMLQCAILDQGVFRGWVGFDENTANRLWTQDQINALALISELLSVFLLKKRAQDKTAATVEGLRMLLDHQNAWIYVIDPETNELFYINQKTKSIAPDSKVGMCCHKAFFDRDSPCKSCPAKGIRGKLNCTMDVYNPILKVWSEADCTLIRWEDKDACLLTCRDISRFKEHEVR